MAGNQVGQLQNWIRIRFGFSKKIFWIFEKINFEKDLELKITPIIFESSIKY